MPRIATRQITTEHPHFPENIRLIQHRKKIGDRIEAQYRVENGTWTSYRIVGSTMAEAIKMSSQAWVTIESGTNLSQLPALRKGRPLLLATIKKRKSAPQTPQAGTFSAAAVEVIKIINAELNKKSQIYGEKSRKLEKYKKNIYQINTKLESYFGKMLCRNITLKVALVYKAQYLNQDGSRPTQSTMGNLSALFRRVLLHAADRGWCEHDLVPSFSKRGLPAGERRPDIQVEDARQILGFMTDAWCNAAPRQTTRWDRRLTRAYVALAITSGARPGTELTELKWRNVRAPRTKSDQWHFGFSGKTGIRNSTVMEAVLQINSYIEDARVLNGGEPDTLVFSRPDGRVAHDSFGRVFKNVLKALKISALHGQTAISPYSIRHYFATDLLRRGVPIHDVANIIGTSIEMIQKTYKHVLPDEMAKKVAGLASDKESRILQATIEKLRGDYDYLQPDGSYPDEYKFEG